MIRGRSLRRIAPLACACAVLAGVAPATAGAQSAVDEYTLDIPGGGASGSSDPGGPPSPSSGATPSSGAAGSSSGPGGVGVASGGGGEQHAGGGKSEQAGGGGEASSAKRTADTQAVADFSELHSGASGFTAEVNPDPRSAPEVVADALLDDAMLPMLGALVLISGIGAWRLLRHRHTPTGAAG
jgi:hypothetical protein